MIFTKLNTFKTFTFIIILGFYLLGKVDQQYVVLFTSLHKNPYKKTKEKQCRHLTNKR
jgi:hypothetical protein